MWFWLGVVWGISIVGGFVWFCYLHNKKEFVTDYPYDDEM